MRAMVLCALIVALSLVSGCGSDDGDKTDACALTGKKTLQYQVSSSSDAECPAIPDEQVDFDKADDEADDCPLEVNEDTCTAFTECTDADGFVTTININVQNEKLTGTLKTQIPDGDEGFYFDCTYLISTK